MSDHIHQRCQTWGLLDTLTNSRQGKSHTYKKYFKKITGIKKLVYKKNSFINILFRVKVRTYRSCERQKKKICMIIFYIHWSLCTVTGLGVGSGKSRASKHTCYLNLIAAMMIIPLLQKWHLSVPYGYVLYVPPTRVLTFCQILLWNRV